jgi:hypothetical protein
VGHFELFIRLSQKGRENVSRKDAMTQRLKSSALFLRRCVVARKNIF